jgi:hypothetical protein
MEWLVNCDEDATPEGQRTLYGFRAVYVFDVAQTEGIGLRLRGAEPSGKAFEEITTTENVSTEGFMCNCMSSLVKGSIVEVILSSRGEHYVGQARVVRKESSDAPWQRYGFQFVDPRPEYRSSGDQRLPSRSASPNNSE